MPGVNDADRRRDADRTEAASPPDAADETGASAAHPPAAAAASLGPPVEPGEVGTLGPYRLVKQLGRGGMGAVYAALDTRLHRRLALKLMLPEFAADPAARERFLREARACAQVVHDNVVTVYDADVRDGVPYIAMQFLEGYPLDEYLKRKGNPTLGQVLRIGRDAAAGLAAAHAKGLVHRDVKPANLWLEAPHGRVKVLDFGLARPVDAEAEITKQGTVVGTPAYMSPEQARGHRVDHRTDLFSLGAVLYRLVTGRLPFEADTTMGVLMALASEEPPPVRERNPAVPVALADLIHLLLAKVPAHRPPSAEDVAARLRAIAQGTAADVPVQAAAGESVPQVVYVPIQVTANPQANPFADLDVTEASGPDGTPAPATGGKTRGRTLLASAAAALLVAAVFAAVVVVIRGRDSAVTKADPPDQPTPTRRGKDGKASATAGPAVPDASPDRRAAEMVLSLGGTVRVSASPDDVTASAGLPPVPFTLIDARLTANPVSDADLAKLAGCRHLRSLSLNRAGLTDDGLAHLQGLTGLVNLSLYDNPVTDAGLARLKGLTALTLLDLNNAQNVTGAGLAHLQGLKALAHLQLRGTRVGDDGLARLAEYPKLHTLWLQDTKVTDAGLVHLKAYPELATVALDNTAVTDAGLAHLRACRSLTTLGLTGTKVTPKAAAEFHAAAPWCRVAYTGGVLEAIDVDRTAAEWVLGLGGVVWVRGGGEVRSAADLPKERFTLTAVSLGNARVADADLAPLDHCRNLTQFSAGGTNVRVTLAGLARHKKLGRIDLGNRGLTDTDLVDLKAFPDLTILTLDGAEVTDAGMVHFKDVPALSILSLSSAKVTDAGLPALAACRKLTTLSVRKSKVTPAGLAGFQKLAPACRVHYDGGVLEPIDVDRPVAEWVLSVGGVVRVNGSSDEVRQATALPKDRFTLTWVRLDKTAVTDADLARLIRAAGLRSLSLVGTGVTDAGMTQVADLPGLRTLTVSHTALTDVGLARLHARRGLRVLHIGFARVTPGGIEAFRLAVPGCRVLNGSTTLDPLDPDRAAAEWVLAAGGAVRADGRDLGVLADLPKERFALTTVTLDDTATADADLVEFAYCARLESLSLAGTKVTSAGLSNLKNCVKLATLSLARTPVGDASSHLRVLPALTTLDLSGSAVDNGGLRRLKECPRLTTLDVRRTKVTAEAIAEFRAAVPGCRVLHDDSPTEPKK